jgi:prophage antirepressor-like protein
MAGEKMIDFLERQCRARHESFSHIRNREIMKVSVEENFTKSDTFASGLLMSGSRLISESEAIRLIMNSQIPESSGFRESS